MHLQHFIVCAAVCLLLLLGFATTTRAQTAQPALTPTSSLVPTTIPQPIATPQPDPEVLILRAQLQQMRDTDSRMLDTVYWALTFVGGLALLLVGYGWFTNRWQYERDKTTMQNEVLSTLEKDLKAQRIEIDKNIEMLFKGYVEFFERSIESSESRTSRKLSMIKRQMVSSDLDEILKEAKHYEEQGAHKDAVDCYEAMLQAIRHDIEDMPDNEVYYSVQIVNALEGIQNALRSGFIPDTGRSVIWHIAMKSLPDRYHTEVETIHKLAQASKGVDVTEKQQ